MKNKLTDLNNHLFAQLERLNDESISPDDLAKEIQRTDAMSTIANQIINTANVALDAAKLVAAHGGNFANILPLVEGKEAVQPMLVGPVKGKKP